MNNLDCRAGVRVTVIAMLLVSGNGCGKQPDAKKAEAQVRRIAAELDRKTTETGVYVRVKEGEINEKDPWGTAVQVSYAQDGVTEIVSVRSAGPDREFHTEDDEVARGIAANFKGVGEGIKKNAGETASKVAKGVVKGAVDGVKESIKDALPFKKKKANDVDQKKGDSIGQSAEQGTSGQ